MIGLVVFAAIVAGFAVGLSSERLARRIGDLAARIVELGQGPRFARRR